MRSVVTPCEVEPVDDLVPGGADLGVHQDRRPGAQAGDGHRLEPPALGRADVVVRRPGLDRPGTRRIEGEIGIDPVRGVHPALEIGDHLVGQVVDGRGVHPVIGRVMGIAVESGGADDRHSRCLGDRAQQVGPSPEPDRRHLDDRSQAGGHGLADLGDGRVGVLQLLARGLGRA